MNDDKLQHHGVKGMRWGVRRYQNKDGSLTALGEKRLQKLEARKTAEDLKDRRMARKLSVQKAKHDMKEDSLDRESNRKVAKKNADAEAKATKAKAKADSEMYELPDTSPEVTQQRIDRGSMMVGGAVALVGVIAAAYAFKRFKASKSAVERVTKQVDDVIKDKNSDQFYKNASKHLNKLRKQKVKQDVKFQKTADNIAKKAAKYKARQDAQRSRYFSNASSAIKKGRQARYNRETSAINIMNSASRYKSYMESTKKAASSASAGLPNAAQIVSYLLPPAKK